MATKVAFNLRERKGKTLIKIIGALLLSLFLGCDGAPRSKGFGVTPQPIPFTVEGTIQKLDVPEFQLEVALPHTKLVQHVKVDKNAKINFSDDSEDVGVDVLKNGQQVIVTGFLSGEPYDGLLKAYWIIILVLDEEEETIITVKGVI